MISQAGVLETTRTQVQSLDRGLQLLEVLSLAREPMGLPELADLLHVDRSTVHRLLATLLQRGFVNQDPDSRRYSLGLRIVELSRHALDGLNLRPVAHPFLKQLIAATNESVNLSVISNGQLICIDHQPSPLPLAVTNEIGVAFLPHATAGGKVLLAYLPESEHARLLGTAPFVACTPRTITDPAALQMHLQLVRSLGYALDDEERFIGVRCIAAPIYDHRRRVIAAVSLSGPSARLSLEKVPGLANLVRGAASDISKAMGYTEG